MSPKSARAGGRGWGEGERDLAHGRFNSFGLRRAGRPQRAAGLREAAPGVGLGCGLRGPASRGRSRRPVRPVAARRSATRGATARGKSQETLEGSQPFLVGLGRGESGRDPGLSAHGPRRRARSCPARWTAAEAGRGAARPRASRRAGAGAHVDSGGWSFLRPREGGRGPLPRSPGPPSCRCPPCALFLAVWAAPLEIPGSASRAHPLPVAPARPGPAGFAGGLRGRTPPPPSGPLGA